MPNAVSLVNWLSKICEKNEKNPILMKNNQAQYQQTTEEFLQALALLNDGLQDRDK